jgi:hypothetical protein
MKSLGFESNDKEQVIGRHYSGVHWDTIEATTLAGGSPTLTIRYLQGINKGEPITGIVTGTQMTPNQRDIAKVTAEGTM